MKTHYKIIGTNGVIIVIAILVLFVVAFFAWRWSQIDIAPRAAYIPESINKELRFTPYVPAWLPSGYSVDVASYSTEGQALIFSAVSTVSKERIVFSEQAIPKDFDMNGFYDGTMKETARLGNVSHATVLGDTKNGGQKVASITAEDTWVIITIFKEATEGDVRQLVNGMVRQ